VRARVTADVDFTMTERTSENYNPQTTAVRSEQTALEPRRPGESAQSQRATRNFEVDRAITHTRAPVGILRKLSVAVILDDLQKTNASGTTTTTPLAQADIDRFTNLVKQAIGFDEQRGDKVNVMNASFKVDAPSTANEESIPYYSQPWFKEAGKQIVGVVLVLLLGFLIVRPVMRSLTTVSVRPAPGGGGVIGELAGDRVTIGGAGAGVSIEQQVAAARNLVGQDPKRAAAVVKDWVAADS
jgi:flagellar M-ring protein FliF